MHHIEITFVIVVLIMQWKEFLITLPISCSTRNAAIENSFSYNDNIFDVICIDLIMHFFTVELLINV